MLNINQLILFSLILMRMSGFILLNPILGRRNIPGKVKSGFILVLSILIFSVSGKYVPDSVSTVEYAVLLIKEFAVGLIIGFVMELFLLVMTFAGSLMDFQMGLSMASVYDANSNVQIALTGKIYQSYFILLFFVSGGHLALIKILVTSAEIIPYGQVMFSQEAAWAVVKILEHCVIMAVKFAFPLIAVELITEGAVGILMKMIPQINVFVVNIQAKIMIGFLALLFLLAPMSEFMSQVIAQMLVTVKEMMQLLHG